MDGRTTRARFEPTRWSLVQRARAGDEQGRQALAELCASYWAPVYAFFRRDGMAEAAARDLTQGLFAELLERGDVAGGDPGKGRFRSYLLACARHYRSNQRDRERAQKRGGDVAHVPIRVQVDDGDEGAGLHALEPSCDETPEQAYLRAWVQESVARALREVGEHERAKGRGAQFERLRLVLDGQPLPGGYAAVAAELGASEAAIKVAAHRLRQRFRAALLSQLGATVEDPADAEAELRELFAALG
ncbi:MAG: RNA polymerase sigma factor [Planctomycetota bacterium]